MVKRICPQCFTRWYSADTASKVWICGMCGAEINDDSESADINENEEDKL